MKYIVWAVDMQWNTHLFCFVYPSHASGGYSFLKKIFTSYVRTKLQAKFMVKAMNLKFWFYGRTLEIIHRNKLLLQNELCQYAFPNLILRYVHRNREALQTEPIGTNVDRWSSCYFCLFVEDYLLLFQNLCELTYPWGVNCDKDRRLVHTN